MKSIRMLMNSDGDHTKSNDGSFHAGCLKKHPLTLGAESCSIPVPYLLVEIRGHSLKCEVCPGTQIHTNRYGTPVEQIWNETTNQIYSVHFEINTDNLQLTETKDNVHTRNSQPTECTASYAYGY